MGKIQVTLTNGHIVDGELTTTHRAFPGTPVLMIEGEPYSAMDAITEGFSFNSINDPIFNDWLNKFGNVSG
jgi:hypothetical protein